MNLPSFHLTKHPLPLQIPAISCSFRPPRPQTLPARDRIIDFGKHKGQMLGTLPSNYLKWVSKNLRARDFEEWAKLADEVLDDPVYRDRIEWEFAEKLLNGDVLTSPVLQDSGNHSAVSRLLELSERFGWDNEDKLGWSKINFKLLGTSKSGRIPRIDENRSGTKTNIASSSKMGEKKNGKARVFDAEMEERRKQRRERLRLQQGGMGRVVKLGIEENDEGSLGNSENARSRADQDVDEERVVRVQSKFPGREGLLKKVLSGKRL